MTQTIAAMKGRFGDTDYYVFTMKAGQLIGNVTIPRDMPDWKDLSVTEIYQREINLRRVRDSIAPYFLQDQSRFIGSFIVTAIGAKEGEKPFSFERLTDALGSGFGKLHVSYKEPANAFGFLTISGSTRLVPLDGQHRLQGIKYAINGQDDAGRAIQGAANGREIADEDVTIIMVEYEPKKARRIFTKVNMYAKKPAKGQTIITDDDNYVAEFSRDIADRIGGRLVKINGNTLLKTDVFFTTLPTIHNCNLVILNGVYPSSRIKGEEYIDDGKKAQYKRKLEEVWACLLKDIEVFGDCLLDKEETGDKQRKDVREKNLLGKPVGQEIMVRAFMRLIGAPTNMSWSDACRRLNQIPWSINNANIEERWQNVVWRGDESRGGIITKNRAIAGRLIAYWAGEKLSPKQVEELENDYLGFFVDRDNRSLPPPVD